MLTGQRKTFSQPNAGSCGLVRAPAGTLLTGSCAAALLLPCSLFPHSFLLCIYSSDPCVFVAEPFSVFDAFSCWQGTASSFCTLESSPLFDPRKPLNNNKSTLAVELSRTGFSYSSDILHLCPIFMSDLRWYISCSWQEVCKTSLALLGRGECCFSRAIERYLCVLPLLHLPAFHAKYHHASPSHLRHRWQEALVPSGWPQLPAIPALPSQLGVFPYIPSQCLFIFHPNLTEESPDKGTN